MNRGIVYTVWGTYNHIYLDRSVASIKDEHTVLNIESTLPGLCKKIDMITSPYDVTCYLDADTQVRDDISYGFDMAEKYGIAVCIAPAGSAYHANPNPIRHLLPVELPQYNTGVIFFDKRKEVVQRVFNRWRELVEQHPKCGPNDQIPFSLAVHENMNPYVLPREWNFRAKIRYEGMAHGKVRILHVK